MGTDNIRVSTVIPASPAEVYAAWLDPVQHEAMTGGRASCDARVGGRHTAWDNYIHGANVDLEPDRRIVQTWRTTEFPHDAPDSRVEITLSPANGGTEIVIDHADIPPGQGTMYDAGWREHYFKPMRRYFEKLAKKASSKPPKPIAKPATTRRPAKKTVAKKATPKARDKAAAKRKPAAKKARTKRAAPKRKAKRKTARR